MKNGIIGKSGMWYECKIYSHLSTADRNWHDAPFIICRHFGSLEKGEVVSIEDNVTDEQMNTLFEWCIHNGWILEDVLGVEV
jgi:hypothetical protein